MRILIIVIGLVALTGRAEAYPQFQLSRDYTCSGCHLTPSGGGLLNENGTNTAEAISLLGQNPEFMYGKIDPPDALTVGGDIRIMGGYHQAPQRYLWVFPMQGDVYGRYTKDKLSVQATIGMRPRQTDNETATTIWPRELYVMWQSEAGSSEGLFARVGHFMPVFGLRWVEHPLYVRRYGGTELFSETWALSASYVKPKYEAHVTGFYNENPLWDPVRTETGGAAAYGEVRLGEKTSVGAGGMGEFDDWEYKLRGALTAKHYLPKPDVLLQGEFQFVNPHVGDYGYKQLVTYAMATYFGPKGTMVDLGWGHYDENLRIENVDEATAPDVDHDCFDLNVHWFATSHIELMLVNRVELMGWGKGGPTGAWAMLQAHYRL
jgi:hypothetical protein